jgi:hypothetical protein
VIQWPLEGEPLIGSRPVARRWRQHYQLAERSPPSGQVGKCAEDAEQWIGLNGVAVSVQLTVIEGAQRQVRTCAQSERGGGDLLVGPDLDRVSGGKRRRLEWTQNGLRIRRAELATRAPQSRITRAAHQESPLVGVANDF